MNPNDADKWFKTTGGPVPLAYKGAINLQAALLLLYEYDHETD